MKELLLAISVVVAVASVGFLMGTDKIGPSVESWQPAAQSDCRQCHDDSRRPAGNMMLPGLVSPSATFASTPATIGGMPDVIVIAQLTRHYSPVVFDHRVHSEMSAITGGCVNCHHNTQVEGQVVSCRECHSIERNGGTLSQPSLKGAYHRQCLGCHRDWSHENGCGYCHREQTPRTDVSHATDLSDIVLTPHPRIEPARTYVYDTAHSSSPLVTFHHSSHAESFDLRCVDCHSGGSCSRCHDGTMPAQAPVSQMSSCRACHATNQCNFCHGQQSREEFDHAKLAGWDLQPQHADVACVECHGRVQTFLSPSTNCRSCHGGLNAKSFDHRITGVPLLGSHASFDCVRCHDESRATTPASCTGCHAGKRYPADQPGLRVIDRS